jgi:hypothetical protein
MAIAPSFVAEMSFRLPPQLPIGVRTADTIYTSFITKDVYFKNCGAKVGKSHSFAAWLLCRALYIAGMAYGRILAGLVIGVFLFDFYSYLIFNILS